MNKKSEDLFIKLFKSTAGLLGETIESNKIIVEVIVALVKTVEFLVRSVSIIMLILFVIILRVFWWDYINISLELLYHGWAQLSEGYKIFFLGIPLLIIGGIVQNIASNFIIEKFIKKSLKKGGNN